MSDLNRIVMSGRLCRDPEIAFTANNTPVCKFAIACGRKVKDKEETSFINVVAWGKAGEIINQHFAKGKGIIVDGRLSQRRWDDKDGKKREAFEIVLDNFSFMGGKGEGRAAPAGQDAPAEVPGGFTDEDAGDDRTPF